MYHITTVDMSEDFRYDLSKVMSIMRRYVSKYIQSRGDQFEVWNYPSYFPSLKGMYKIV